MGFWAICSGVPRNYWFNVLVPMFDCDLLQNIGFFVVLDWLMKREAPQSISLLPIAFNDLILVFN